MRKGLQSSPFFTKRGMAMEPVCFEAVLDEKQMQKVASLAEDIWYEHYGRLLGE